MSKPVEQKILDELLEGEFKGLVDIELGWRINCDGRTLAQAYWDPERPEKTGIIKINEKYQERLQSRTDILREVLRHELLHIELKADDSDSLFNRVAEQRKIIWTSFDGAKIGRELEGWQVPLRPIIRYAYNTNKTMTLSIEGKPLATTKPFPLKTAATT